MVKLILAYEMFVVVLTELHVHVSGIKRG